MSVIENRLRENYPPILMTLVSLIIALVYENLVSGIALRREPWRVTPENFFLWSQWVVLAVAPLMYWFTLSLHTASIRVVFSPRDGFTAVAGGVGFFILASKVGATHAEMWLYAGAALFAAAWVGWREFGRLYASDPAVSGDSSTHRASRRTMLAGAAVMALGAILLQTNVVGLIGAGAALLAGVLGFGIAAHIRWYAEWKEAVGLPRPKEQVDPQTEEV